jgi:protein phosphatase
MKITLPEMSLVVLIGASGSGKSSFGRKHFKATEVLSSDFFRSLISDDENDQTVTKEAFASLHFVASKRLAAGKLTVIDATNVQPEARKALLNIAREYYCLAIAIVFQLPERICHERNQQRPDRRFGSHVVRIQSTQLRKSLSGLKKEGFHEVYMLHTPEQVDSVEIVRQKLWNNRKEEHGPFDIIGDIHGCFDELQALLQQLGYQISVHQEPVISYDVSHPQGRKAVFLGDLVDRGPNVPAVLRIIMDMVTAGTALCIPGSHDVKLLRKLNGRNVNLTHGIVETLQQLEAESVEFKEQVREFLDSLVSHYVLDNGKLVVAHAGLKSEMQGRAGRAVRDFVLYGETRRNR